MVMKVFTLRRTKAELPELKDVLPPLRVKTLKVPMRWEEAKAHSKFCMVLAQGVKDMEENKQRRAEK